jgi:putative ATP-binding cassette transporter
VLTAPLSDLERIGQSKLMMALTDDLGRIADCVPNLVFLVTNLTLIVAYLVYLGWLSLSQLMITLAIAAIGLACSVALRRRGTKQVRLTRQKGGELVEEFRGFFDGIKEFKLNAARGASALQGLAKTAGELDGSVRRQGLFFGGSAIVVQCLFYTALGFVMFDGASRNVDGQTIASYGVAIVYLMGPLQVVIEMFQGIAAASIALDRFKGLGIALEDAGGGRRRERAIQGGATRERALCPLDEFRDLQCSGIMYSYTRDAGRDGVPFVLGPVDLTLRKGEIVFVIGANGSGKTTFAKVLAGLYVPVAGSIRVNGRTITRDDMEWSCELFSAIFHDFVVFDQLLDGGHWSNELLRTFEIQGRIEIENNRIKRSSELSVGERKRLALMFAYLDDKPIVILDEWAADQDPNYKETFYRTFLQELRARGKLVIVISHDDRYFQLGDKVLYLGRGAPIAREYENS